MHFIIQENIFKEYHYDRLISKILLVINKTSSFYNYWNSSTITTKTNIKIENDRL